MEPPAPTSSRRSALVRLYVRIFLETGMLFGLLIAAMGVYGASGALISGLSFGLLMSASLGTVAALRTRHMDPQALRVRHARSLEVDGTREHALQQVETAMRKIPRLRSVRADTERGVLRASTRVSWWSWGDVLTARVGDIGQGRQRVFLESQPLLASTVVNFGESARNVQVVVDHLTRSGAVSNVVEARRVTSRVVLQTLLTLLALAGLVLAVRPLVHVPRVHVASYSHADYDKAMSRLGRATTPLERYVALGDAAKTSVFHGPLDQAQALAEELLSAAAKQDRRDWNYGNAVHDGHMVLGLVALRRGNTKEAAQELLLAGGSPGSPQLGSFGPNMMLAKELIERGERQAVLEYFDRCRVFWGSSGGAQLNEWADDVRDGRMPDFEANLVF